MQAASASAAAGSGGRLAWLGSKLLEAVCRVLPDSGSAVGCMTLAASLLAVTAVAALVRQRLRRLETSFITGSWPPPRNTSKVE